MKALFTLMKSHKIILLSLQAYGNIIVYRRRSHGNAARLQNISSTRMKILHVTKKYPRAIGGDSMCVFNLERWQIQSGHQVYILTTNCREIPVKDNLYRFGLPDQTANWDRVTIKRILSLFFFIFQSIPVIAKVKPDIIHAHSSDLGFIISLWAVFFHIPVINTCHGISFPYKFIPRLKRYPEWFFLKFGLFRKIIVVDGNSLERFSTYSIKKAEYIPMTGVDFHEFNRNKRERDISNRGNIIRFIFVGRIDDYKGLDHLVHAAAIVKEKLEHFEILIIGEGPCHGKIKNLGATLGVQKYLTFFGPITVRSRLISMYWSADILVHPSLLEGFPLTVFEAWAAEIAVIVTDVGGVNRICRHEENCLLIPSGDPGPLAAAMISLATDTQLRIRIAQAGRALAADEYDWSRRAQAVEETYREVIDAHRR